MKNIVLIDDLERQLEELKAALLRILKEGEVELRLWIPRPGDENPEEKFAQMVNSDTTLVVTDYDLTGGQTGLFGSTIVQWCQKQLIPVGDFSRGDRNPLPKQPNQYEIRVPSDTELAATYIADAARGFNQIRTALERDPSLLSKKSPVAILAQILGRPQEVGGFALYGGRLAVASSAIVEQMARVTPQQTEPSDEDKRKILTYVIGHLLLNIILRFPGPLLHTRAFAAYLAIAEAEVTKVEEIFRPALYSGPFGAATTYYWLSDVDEILDRLGRAQPSDGSSETIGQLNREAIELRLNAKLARHDCPRCRGVNGGFVCPFTHRTVCQRADCSVSSSAWIPPGARLCRIERDFYDEWSPVLGF